MKIKLNGEWLAGDPDDPFKSQAADLKVDGRRLVQQEEGIRATDVRVFDRLNHSSSVSFSVTRLHASLHEAQLFILDHPASVPGSGDLEFIIQSGGVDLKRTLPGAVLSSVICTHTGVTTRHSYTLQGPRITS